MKSQDNTSKNLYDLVVSQGLDPTVLDASGKETISPEEGEIISFEFEGENNYGTVVLVLDSNSNIEVYYGDNVGKSMEAVDKEKWYDFLNHIRNFARKNLKTFSVKDISKLKHTMKGMAAIKEGLFESYYGNKKFSYADQPQKTRLVIKHSRDLQETDARFRYIESLFVENGQGERFRLPFTKLSGGKAMARHVSEGGNPYDPFGQHIVSLVKEMNTLGRFLRASHNNLNEETAHIVEQAKNHYDMARNSIKAMATSSGYHSYRENWSPADGVDRDDLVEQIKNMFIEKKIDSRIEEALPLLAQIMEKEKTMKEINEFQSWIESVSVGQEEMIDEEMDTIEEESEKPDYIDLNKDGDTEESMKKAAKDKESDKEKVDETSSILDPEIKRILELARKQ